MSRRWRWKRAGREETRQRLGLRRPSAAWGTAGARGKAAEQNFAEAQINLGACYANGQGVERDYAEAAKWFRKAAVQNNTKAQFHLGDYYSKGVGVAMDYVEAYAWFNLAARSNLLAASFRDRLTKKMTPEQINDGTQLTEKLRAQIEAKLKSGSK